MLKEAHQMDRDHSPAQDQSILPMMTALFVKGLGGTNGAFANTEPIDPHKIHCDSTAKIFRMPIPEEATLIRSADTISPETCFLNRRSRVSVLSQRPSEPSSALRLLIYGISHHFNNLLMGIWGNATLIRMQLSQDSDLHQQVSQMEHLIQTGSFLIHTVLGYIGERRSLAKKIRLNQLLYQIKQNIPEEHCSDVHWDFETALRWASRIQRPRMVAGSTAEVLEVLFRGIQGHRSQLGCLKHNNDDMQDKLEMIDQLIKRGQELTHQLRLYASDSKLKVARLRLAPLVRRVLNQIYNLPVSIQVNFDPGKNLPLISGERRKLEWVIEQLIDNAVSAMPRGGTIDITLRTLQQEAAQDRCAVQKGCDYVVITIKDNGKGISQKIQKSIFEPFFSYPVKKHRIGVGLAAADGVLRSHGGYIQVQSKHRFGSTFKLYLPIAGAALQGQELKHLSGS